MWEIFWQVHILSPGGDALSCGRYWILSKFFSWILDFFLFIFSFHYWLWSSKIMFTLEEVVTYSCSHLGQGTGHTSFLQKCAHNHWQKKSVLWKRALLVHPRKNTHRPRTTEVDQFQVNNLPAQTITWK
jgi:hypothetical protein